jgi:cation diffusion facilitator CzcD-associated flavoprotein CzcO
LTEAGETITLAHGDHFDAVVIGAGFGGLYALYRLRKEGLRVVVIEAGEGIGGTWFWNRYPGARCDVPSLEYSYAFSDELQQEWRWSERYAAQPEIERYINHVADRFDLRRDIVLGRRVVRTEFDAAASQWALTTDDGLTVTATFCVAAVGGYSTPIVPDIEGLDDFEGELYYSHHWPNEEVSYAGKRIGVVGTGSSGMQTVTEVARQPVEHLYVFQRTPNYCVPANNGPMDPAFEAEWKRNYAHHREVSRNSSFGVGYPVGEGRTMDLSDEQFLDRIATAWDFGGPAVLSAFPDFLVDEDANERVAEFFRSQVRRRVDDPVVAELLCAKTHYIGARRLLVEEGYYESFNQPNVTLVDVAASPIERLTTHSLVTKDAEYELDMIVLATGFDSGSGTMLRLNPIGRGGVELKSHWATGPNTLLGMMMSGFPNLFMIWGPGSPGIRSQGALMAEIQSDWVADAIVFIRARDLVTVEPIASAEEGWSEHVADVAHSSLTMKNETQYVGANVPGKPRVYTAYLGGVGFYQRFSKQIADEGYPGFRFGGADGHVEDGPVFVAPGLADIRVSAI